MLWLPLAVIFLTSPSTLPPANLSKEDSVAVRTIVEKYMTRNKIPGIVVGIVRGEKMIYAKAFGVRNKASGAPVIVSDKFPIASITKLFTGTGIMQLAEKGSLSIDDPVVKYLPYFKVKGDYTKITLKHLLTHTSGLPPILTKEEWLKGDSSPDALEKSVRDMQNMQLINPPGTKFGYSNLGFMVLADVIAKVSKIEYETYVSTNILKPLSMTNSGFIRSSVPDVRPHIVRGKKIVPVDNYEEDRRTNGAGGLECSIADLCTWAMMALGNGSTHGARVLEENTFKLMIEPQVVEYQDETYDGRRGLAWQVIRYQKVPFIGHGGRYKTGGRSMMFIQPEKALGIAFVANLTFDEEIELLTEIEKAMD